MQALGDEDALGNCSTSGCAPLRLEHGDDLDFESSDGDDAAGDTQPHSGDYGDEVDDSLSLVQQLRIL